MKASKDINGGSEDMNYKIIGDDLLGNILLASDGKMKKEALSQPVVDFFKSLLTKVVKGDRGFIFEKTDIEVVPAGMILEMDQISTKENIALGKQMVGRTVILKLNGGLGTGMGLDRAKSLLEINEGVNYLDAIVAQVTKMREESGQEVPLLFMDSFGTTTDTLGFLNKNYPDLAVKGLPLDMVQNKFPKINQDGKMPAAHPTEALNWNPPGHGDVYTVLHSTGMLENLLAAGIKYALISNSDNLGATYSNRIVGFMEKNNVPFIMETAKRIKSDVKGGHLAKKAGEDKLALRELANCPADEEDSFIDIDKWTDFNTNNIWLNLESLKKILIENDGVMPLDLIVNSKVNNPQAGEDSDNPADTKKVYQLETAMGSAISYFDGAKAVRVDTTKRFFPTKKSSDLLLLRSDALILNLEDGSITLNSRQTKPVVLLDDNYKTTQDLKAMCPEGYPSLKDCDNLEIKGPVIFGENVVIKGNVKIVNKSENPLKIDSNTVLENVVISQ